jgi:hypothetical protein
MEALEERLLRELRRGGQLPADDLANRIQARHWVELSTALSQLASKGLRHGDRPARTRLDAL